MFDWHEETREVADALALPIAGGEQEYSLPGIRWLIANDALEIVQPDTYFPTGPGFAVDIDPAFVAKHRVVTG